MILIVAAMQEEAYKISYPHVIVTGVGKVNAAHHLTDALAKNKVDAIINVGFAGASNHYQVGEVIVIKEAMYHDFDLSAFGYQKGEVPHIEFPFKSDKKWLNKALSLLKNAKVGTLYTGDYFMTEAVDKPYVCDMEGASLYQVAALKKVPIISIKVVSDIIGMDKHIENYKAFEQTKGAAIIAEIVKRLTKE